MRGMIAIVAITICCLADPLAPLDNMRLRINNVTSSYTTHANN
jgi:hypothetical protein